MRFIGNKENIIPEIYSIFLKYGINGNSFCDLFAGTANVGKFFKNLGCQIFSSDLLYFSFCLQKAYLENNSTPNFENILKESQSNLLGLSPLGQVIDILNNLPLKKGFIYNNYSVEGTLSLEIPRKYFSSTNAQKIDTIRGQIELWKPIITEQEYFILLACLIETVPFYANISGVYAAFQKKWDARALKNLKLKPVQLVINNKENKTYNGNSLTICPKIDVDILYLDPPYNQRQYAPNYHLLETIAKYDNPTIYGVAGLRHYNEQKSSFCNAKTAIEDLNYIAKTAKYKYLILSYNSEGIMPQEIIIGVLSQYGKVTLEQFQYTRFKSNNNGTSKLRKFVYEQLYILKKDQK